MFDGESLTEYATLRDDLFGSACRPGEGSPVGTSNPFFSADGSIWVLFSNCGIAEFSDGIWVGYRNPDIFTNDWWNGTSEICTSPDGQLWIARGGGLYGINSDRTSWRIYRVLYKIFSIACAPDGSIWLGTADGTIARFRP
jgi:hypothetical protein